MFVLAFPWWWTYIVIVNVPSCGSVLVFRAPLYNMMYLSRPRWHRNTENNTSSIIIPSFVNLLSQRLWLDSLSLHMLWLRVTLWWFVHSYRVGSWKEVWLFHFQPHRIQVYIMILHWDKNKLAHYQVSTSPIEKGIRENAIICTMIPCAVKCHYFFEGWSRQAILHIWRNILLSRCFLKVLNVFPATPSPPTPPLFYSYLHLAPFL